MNLLRRYKSDTRGIAATEAALMLPFLLATCFGTIDVSYLMLQNHKMEAGLTSAGSYLAKTRTPQNFETQAKRLATTGDITSGGKPIVANWTTNDVTVTYRKIANTPTQSGMSYRGGATIDVIQISSELTYQGLGFLRSIMGDDVKIKASYEERLIGSSS